MAFFIAKIGLSLFQTTTKSSNTVHYGKPTQTRTFYFVGHYLKGEVLIFLHINQLRKFALAQERCYNYHLSRGSKGGVGVADRPLETNHADRQASLVLHWKNSSDNIQGPPVSPLWRDFVEFYKVIFGGVARSIDTILDTILFIFKEKGYSLKAVTPCLYWRRDRDSNPRYVAVHLISSQAPSTTRTSLHAR